VFKVPATDGILSAQTAASDIVIDVVDNIDDRRDMFQHGPGAA